MSLISESITKLLHERVVTKAIDDARDGLNDFPLSYATHWQPSEELEPTRREIADTLANLGHIGTIYVEQNKNIGNGPEDVGLPRVNIEFRDGESIQVPRLQRIGSSTLETLAWFPEGAYPKGAPESLDF